MPCLILPKSQFLHIPKTGGKWVQQALQAGGVEFEEWSVTHCDVRSAPYPERFTFSFVRNPLTWWQSVWRYGMVRKTRNQSIWPPFRETLLGESFGEFIEDVLAEHNGLCSRVFANFTGQFVGKQESLAEDLVRALTAAGETFNEGRIMAEPPYHLTDKSFDTCYTPELMAAVIMAERDAIGRFGYGEDCERMIVKAEKCYQPDQQGL